MPLVTRFLAWIGATAIAWWTLPSKDREGQQPPSTGVIVWEIFKVLMFFTGIALVIAMIRGRIRFSQLRLFR